MIQLYINLPFLKLMQVLFISKFIIIFFPKDLYYITEKDIYIYHHYIEI